MTEKKIIKFTPYKFPEAEINLFIAEKNLSQAPVIHYNRPNTYEIGYIFSGQGSYFINNRFYPIRRGMVFFINDCDFICPLEDPICAEKTNFLDLIIRENKIQFQEKIKNCTYTFFLNNGTPRVS